MLGNLGTLNQPTDPAAITPESIKLRRQMAQVLARGNQRPIRHWAEGLANMTDQLVGSYQMGQLDRQEAEARKRGAAESESRLARILAGVEPATPRPDTVSGGAGGADAPNIPANLVASESGGNWQASNDVQRRDGTRGHFGRLQFSTPRIQEAIAAGALPPGTTPQAFMASPELQRSAERWHFNDIDNQIRTSGLDRMIGQSINGVPVTMDGLRAVAHLGGVGGMRQFVQSGGRYNPADANGTSLLDYLRRHQGGAAPQVVQAPRQPAPDSVDGGDGGAAQAAAAELGLRQPTALTSGAAPDVPMGLAAPAMTPEQAMGALPQMRAEDAPLVDGRFLPPGDTTPAMGRPAMAPLEAFNAALGPGTTGTEPPMTPRAPLAIPEITVGGTPEQPGAPMAAPMPMPRPVQASAAAPMPAPRPNIEPPPAAAPAGPALMPAAPGLSERDRLMLLRDEQSLPGGEAQSLRAGLTGAPIQMQAPNALAGPPVSPVAAALAQTPAATTPPSPVAQAMAGAPAAAQPASKVAQLMAIVNNPWAPEGTRAMAQTLLQREMRSPAEQERERLQLEQARLGVQQTQRQVNAPMPGSPEAAAAQRAQREKDADTAGLQGDARRRFILTGQYEQSPDAALRARNEANAAEGQRLGLTGDRLQYYTIHGKLPDSVGNLSAADKRAGREALDEIPTVRSAVASLERALELNPRAYSGYTAGAMATIGTSGIPGAGMLADPERAKASREFNQLMSGQAIEAMSAALKGATTDNELRQFVEILANPSTPPDIRERTIRRMLSVAKMKEAQLTDRATMLPEAERRSLNMQVDRGGAAATAAPAAARQPPADAVTMLKSNPTETARRQFDEVFGAGAAARALGGS